jgi:hypothetical protein
MWQIILLLLIFSQGIHLLLSPSKQKELAEKRDLRRRTGCQSWNQQNSMRIWTEKNERLRNKIWCKFRQGVELAVAA